MGAYGNENSSLTSSETIQDFNMNMDVIEGGDAEELFEGSQLVDMKKINNMSESDYQR